MADQYYNHFLRHSNNKQSSKVYINPNYNRQTDNSLKQSTTMYFNPNFRQILSAPHHYHDNARTRIHLNPNFMRNSVPSQVNHITVDSYTRQVTTLVPDIPSFINNHQQPNVLISRANTGITEPAMTTQITKSRYCLVNKHDHLIKPAINLEVNSENFNATKVQSNTVRVNKYKLVSISDVKIKLASQQKAVAKTVVNNITASTNNSCRYKTRIKPVLRNNPNKFKLVKHSTVQINSQSTFKYRSNNTLNKSIRTLTARKKISKGVLKKNNIPCPLFKKFGKCLRKIRGNCEYLHDKKHVSICRKFLKGICHDEDCLLSHDLTVKKMPTCYFYLQGACMNENCPYLHVKLNDKANVCPDFLKGYCEKGDKCLNRHVNLKPGKEQTTNQNRKIVRRVSTTKFKVNAKKRSPRKEVSNKAPLQRETKPVGDNDKRYFVETIEMNAENYDVIKPTRCKLGTLPSFIQL